MVKLIPAMIVGAVLGVVLRAGVGPEPTPATTPKPEPQTVYRTVKPGPRPTTTAPAPAPDPVLAALVAEFGEGQGAETYRQINEMATRARAERRPIPGQLTNINSAKFPLFDDEP